MLLQKLPNKLVFTGLLLVPMLLIGLPADFFDSGKSICLSVVLVDKPCGACGITRAIQHAVHGEFSTAWHYNKMVVVIAPLLIALWGNSAYAYFVKIRARKNPND